MRATEVELDIPYEFTAPELLQLGRMMAEERFRLQQTMDELKASKEAFKDRIEIHEGEIFRLAGLVKRGAENRPTKCHISYNDPHAGEKSIYRKDTGELVKTVPMTDSERQEELPIAQGSAGDAAPETEHREPDKAPPAEQLFPEDSTISAIAEKVADAVNQGALDKAGVTVAAEVNPPKKSRKRKEHYAADVVVISSAVTPVEPPEPPEAA